MTKTIYKVNLSLIKKRREYLNMTRSQVAEALDLPYDKYSRRENGDYKFKAEELPALSETLMLPLEKIFINDFSKTENKKAGAK